MTTGSQQEVEEALAAHIRRAAAEGSALCIRGGGTKDFYGNSPQGQALSTRALAGVVSYEPSELVVTVAAGTPLTEVEDLLAQHNQCLAFEPPRFGPHATVGGMVAAGLSGPARANAGGLREYVLGVRLINGRGEILKFGGQVMKNVAGYDVSRVMAGSLGVLALIVEVSLKVMPRASAEATLRFEWPEHEALARLNAWGAQPLPLSASSWQMENGVPVLHLRLRGAVAAVEWACRQLGGARMDAPEAQAHWDACREQTLPFFVARDESHALWRLSVPQTAPTLGSAAEPVLIEWHGAQRWVQAPLDAEQALREAARRAGGHATLFRRPAAGPRAPDEVFEPLSAPLERIHRELKKQFDPAGIFNPGRLYRAF